MVSQNRLRWRMFFMGVGECAIGGVLDVKTIWAGVLTKSQHLGLQSLSAIPSKIYTSDDNGMSYLCNILVVGWCWCWWCAVGSGRVHQRFWDGLWEGVRDRKCHKGENTIAHTATGVVHRNHKAEISFEEMPIGPDFVSTVFCQWPRHVNGNVTIDNHIIVDNYFTELTVDNCVTNLQLSVDSYVNIDR